MVLFGAIILGGDVLDFTRLLIESTFFESRTFVYIHPSLRHASLFIKLQF